MSVRRSGLAGFLRVNGVFVVLSESEERALELLRARTVVPFARMAEIWPSARSVHSSVSSLKRKLHPTGLVVMSCRGEGYRLVNAVTA